jgi:hypothetical protein
MYIQKSLLPVIFLALAFVPGHAQIRHVRGIKSVDFGYLKSKHGVGAAFGYARYYSNSVYGKAVVSVELGQDAGMSYRSVFLDIMAARTFVHRGHSIYVNAVGGITAAMDAVVRGGEQFGIGSEFKTGALFGLEAECFISDRLVLVLGWNQRVLIREAFGNYRWYGQGGFRFNF